MRKAAERGIRPVRFNWRRSLALVLQGLRESGLLKGSIVILTGSYAHGTETPKSDLDVLVLQYGSRERIRAPYGVHLQVEELDDFRKRLTRGDDFVIDALRYGELLHDGLGLWEELRRDLEHAKWPDWRAKIGQARRRIELADELLRSGDLDAATEEYLLTATQVARARLLRKGIYPMSRPQLSQQLVAVGETDLAGDLDRLIDGSFQETQLRRIGRDLRKALERA